MRNTFSLNSVQAVFWEVVLKQSLVSMGRLSPYAPGGPPALAQVQRRKERVYWPSQITEARRYGGYIEYYCADPEDGGPLRQRARAPDGYANENAAKHETQ
jgi:hypothetical protein